MSDQTSQPEVLENTVAEKQSSEPKVERKSESRSPRKETNSGASFAILLSLLALIGSGFTWYQTQIVNVQKESALVVGVSEIGGQVSRLGDSVSRLQQDQSKVVSQEQLSLRISQLSNEIALSNKSLAEQQSAIDISINKINDELQKGVSAYVIDEVAQLLKLANHSAVLSNDAPSAITALNLADNQLKQLSDPRFATVRQQINQEVAALENRAQTDVQALSASLSAISTLVPELPLANEPENRPVAVAAIETTSELSWRSELAKLWQDIKGSIQVQRVDQPPKPLLAPAERYFLNQNLQLNLNKAEIALLQRQPAIFKQSVLSSINWLNEYFDLEDQRVQSVISQLQSMQGQNLEQSLPDISGSYQALLTVRGE